MLIVKKFGGTSVGNKERMYNVANRCIEEYEKGNDVVVVLSAMGKYTDELISMAHDMDDKPPKREMDMLLTIGEQMSVSLMAMVTLMAWRTSTVTVRPRIPLRTCRRPSANALVTSTRPQRYMPHSGVRGDAKAKKPRRPR